MSPPLETDEHPAPPPLAGKGPSYVLGLETSTPWGGAALLEASGRTLGHVWGHARTGYSRRLMPTIDFLLRSSGLKATDLAAIAVTHGPGSFTGVRIGLVTAKTLAQSLGIPLYTFSTLESLASRWPLHDRPIAVLLDARRKEIYSGVFRRGPSGVLERVRPDSVESPAKCFEALAAMTEDSIWLAGDAVEKTRPLWQAVLKNRARSVDVPWGLPAAESVARMASRALIAGSAPCDPILASPHYIRASDAIKGLGYAGPASPGR